MSPKIRWRRVLRPFSAVVPARQEVSVFRRFSSQNKMPGRTPGLDLVGGVALPSSCYSGEITTLMACGGSLPNASLSM